MARILRLDPNRVSGSIVRSAASVVRGGGVIIYPTDTIYGLGCDAADDRAIERIFQIKRRPESQPALMLVRNISMVRDLVADIPPAARTLIDSFWPGPLTIVFSSRRKMHPFVVSRDGTIALRVPENRFCLKLLSEVGRPILSTSVNVSGKHPRHDVQSLIDEFARSVDLFIDVGDIQSVRPSTIVNVTGPRVVIVRDGIILRDKIERCLRGVRYDK